MRLLVSVANAEEASAALAGGADVIDAKDARAGALGAVTRDVLQDIYAVVQRARPVTAALGDAADEAAIERAARDYAAAGAGLVKVGFAGIVSAGRAAALTAAAVRGARAAGGGVVAVAYADAAIVESPVADDLVDVAAAAGARGLLVDTADKSGPGLRALVTPNALAALVARAHGAGLLVALAGKLTADDLAFVRDAGADIAGVRGAVCEGGRRGRITVQKVRDLKGWFTRCGTGAHRSGANADRVACVDTVVKIGGGVLAHLDQFAAALAAIGTASQDQRLLVVPGGGPFADTVREVDRRIGLPDSAAHWMAVLAMEQYAHLIASRLAGAALVGDPSGIVEAIAARRVPVLAPYRWLRAIDPLPHSWDVTSDSIAAWVSGSVGARRLVLVKPAAVGLSASQLVDAYFNRALPPQVPCAIVTADQLDTLDALLCRSINNGR